MANENASIPIDASAQISANGHDDQPNAAEAAQRSKKECRVYVGNLSYEVKWNILKDFMREGACRNRAVGLFV